MMEFLVKIEASEQKGRQVVLIKRFGGVLT
jgi:hypothetical protein